MVMDCALTSDLSQRSVGLVGPRFKRNWGSAPCQAGGQSYHSSQFGRSRMMKNTLLWVSLGTVPVQCRTMPINTSANPKHDQLQTALSQQQQPISSKASVKVFM